MKGSLILPPVTFGQVFRLMEDFTGGPLNKRALAQQALEKYRAKYPQAKVDLYEEKPGGQSLFLPGLPRYYLLLEESLAAYRKLYQDTQAAAEAELQAKNKAKPCLNEKVKQAVTTLTEALKEIWRSKLQSAMVPLLKTATPLNVQQELKVREPQLQEGIDFFLPARQKKKK